MECSALSFASSAACEMQAVEPESQCAYSQIRLERLYSQCRQGVSCTAARIYRADRMLSSIANSPPYGEQCSPPRFGSNVGEPERCSGHWRGSNRTRRTHTELAEQRWPSVQHSTGAPCQPHSARLKYAKCKQLLRQCIRSDSLLLQPSTHTDWQVRVFHFIIGNNQTVQNTKITKIFGVLCSLILNAKI